MRIGCLIQARLNSTRLPNKINADLGGRPMIWHVTQRIPKNIPHWVIMPGDFPVSDNDVLGRYALAAEAYQLDGIIRVTGDCPLFDPAALSKVLYLFQTLLYDYVANDIERTWPDGMGVEIFSRTALDCANREATKAYDREHVTPFMKQDKRNTCRNIRCPINGISDLKLSVDTQEDLDFVRAIDAAGPRDFSLAATLEAIERVQAKNHA